MSETQILNHHSNLSELFSDIAVVLRGKTGSSEQIRAAQFPSIIRQKLQSIQPYKSFLTFKSPNSFTLSTFSNTKGWDGIMEYSTDTEHWAIWDSGASLSSGSSDGVNVLYVRGTGNHIIQTPTTYKASNWVLNGSDVECIGNIETIFDYVTVEAGQHPPMQSGSCACLFANCTALTRAPDLMATALTVNCYYEMFYGCTSLVTPPILPATVLAEFCYKEMFRDCTSLAVAPALPATTLAPFCYQEMFKGCTGLITPPALPAVTLADCCYYKMFTGCTSLATSPALPATKLPASCYSEMFFECKSLTLPPEMHPTTVSGSSCARMFMGCSELTQAPDLPATTLAKSCYIEMFANCQKLPQVPALPATTLADHCYAGMFTKCSVIRFATAKSSAYTQAYRIPTNGTGVTAADALTTMLDSTGGTFRGTPSINTTYYLSSNNKIIA